MGCVSLSSHLPTCLPILQRGEPKKQRVAYTHSERASELHKAEDCEHEIAAATCDRGKARTTTHAIYASTLSISVFSSLPSDFPATNLSRFAYYLSIKVPLPWAWLPHSASSDAGKESSQSDNHQSASAVVITVPQPCPPALNSSTDVDDDQRQQ